MKPIEETHPSLKHWQKGLNQWVSQGIIFDVQEHTIDKQKVRKFIQAIENDFPDADLNEWKGRLGL